MIDEFTSGNQLQLLENGEEYFPAVFEAIRRARSRVILETFIIFEDKVGNALRDALVEAAKQGADVDVTVDGYGTADISSDYVDSLTSVGVRFHIYDPRPRRLGFRTNLFWRMHRKIVVVDDDVAFIGGINFGADHLGDYGEGAKQDYAVAIRGPAVDQIKHFASDALKPPKKRRKWQRLRWPTQSAPPQGTVALVVRDNDKHTNDIELHYRIALRTAKKEVMLANAYFFPGYRFLRDLRHAAQRGVAVRLVLQGEPDMPVARFVATMLYDYLISAGVEIYEYCERPLHGKIAVVDDAWSTVGSSNLDPFSLALNLEANVIIYDEAFSQVMKERLGRLIADHCRLVTRDSRPRRNIEKVFLGTLVFHFLRRFPMWVRYLPHKQVKLTSITEPSHSASEKNS